MLSSDEAPSARANRTLLYVLSTLAFVALIISIHFRSAAPLIVAVFLLLLGGLLRRAAVWDKYVRGSPSAPTRGEPRASSQNQGPR